MAAADMKEGEHYMKEGGNDIQEGENEARV
jgi:hypothetical protein